ncbi:MAG: hypothetical protein Ct9H300mP16_05500 [Pseudomonadota bacterium]|nr:MAG: hypothetical protein Ct9H300mP16_05500 [Pseudomonadota bacterium]
MSNRLVLSGQSVFRDCHGNGQSAGGIFQGPFDQGAFFSGRQFVALARQTSHSQTMGTQSHTGLNLFPGGPSIEAVVGPKKRIQHWVDAVEPVAAVGTGHRTCQASSRGNLPRPVRRNLTGSPPGGQVRNKGGPGYPNGAGNAHHRSGGYADRDRHCPATREGYSYRTPPDHRGPCAGSNAAGQLPRTSRGVSLHEAFRSVSRATSKSRMDSRTRVWL